MNVAALQNEVHRLERHRRLYTAATIAIVAAIIISGYGQASMMNSGSFIKGLNQFFDYPGEIVKEAWAAGAGFFPLLWKFMPALIETLNIAAVATILGGIFALLLSFMSTQGLAPWPRATPLFRRTMDIMRAFPELIIALFLIFVLGTSPVPAMIAVAFHTAGALGKLFSEVNENIDRKPLEGLQSVGAGWTQRMKYGVVPQVLPNYLSYFLLRLEINVRASAILGFVGAGGIGAELRRTIGWGQGAGDETAALFVLLLISIFVIDQLSSYLRQRLVQGGQESAAQDGDGNGMGGTGNAGTVYRSIRRRTLLSFAATFAVIAYLAYTWQTFEVTRLIEQADPQRAVILGTDAVAHKVHVTKNLRREGLIVAVEGERTAQYKEFPAWVDRVGETDARIDLGDGYLAEINGKTLRFTVPGYGVIEATATAGGVETRLPPGPLPDWLSARDDKFDARPTLDRRVQVSRARIEVHRYFLGWENFFFPFDSDLHGKSFGEVFDLATSGERVKAEMPNWRYVFQTFWRNPDWQHGEVFKALLETLLMAVLGTFTAAFVGLPLAILAAKNFAPSEAVRFFVRRLFDFLRGIDMLIWSLIFIRAFGLGPLTGALAIAFTDTGTLGKLFSEALENIDNKQVEGVQATGASRFQRYRFGVIPQILPVFVSQGLYYLESNTRSATVIGALGAGGIGLLLVETIRTARDWENTLYIILLTVILVMAMDSLSTWLRGHLIHGKGERA